jgi:GIY-YIG catalytic domain-containing protein
MIPAGLAPKHVLAAMADIDRHGVPQGRAHLKFVVRHGRHSYPPKFVISIACKVAFGKPLSSSKFSGGSETNRLLQKLGFPIYRRSSGQHYVRVFDRDTSRLKARLREQPLYAWVDLASNPMLPPKKSGVYAWFFDDVPAGVPTNGCVRRGGRVLLYVGISPVSETSGANLHTRIRYHFLGNAEGSTLRKTLGCLLAKHLGIGLRRVGSGKRMTFGPRERALTAWMKRHVRVTWILTTKPRRLEKRFFAALTLPLNLEGNAHSPFYPHLKRIRTEAIRRARSLQILKHP